MGVTGNANRCTDCSHRWTVRADSDEPT
ncbi:hypothetical protein [Cutibacterium acnes]